MCASSERFMPRWIMFLFAVDLLQIHGSRRVSEIYDLSIWSGKIMECFPSHSREKIRQVFQRGTGMFGIDLRVWYLGFSWHIYGTSMEKGETSKTITASYIPLEGLFIISRRFLRQKGPKLVVGRKRKKWKPFSSRNPVMCPLKGTSHDRLAFGKAQPTKK